MKQTILGVLIAVNLLFLAACATTGTPPLSPVSAALPPLPEGVFDEANVEIKPEAIRRVPPNYPSHLKSRGISGEVTLAFIVGADGKVRDIVVTSATNEDFARAAIDSLRQWSFKPARVNGAAVSCRISPFKLTFDT